MYLGLLPLMSLTTLNFIYFFPSFRFAEGLLPCLETWLKPTPYIEIMKTGKQDPVGEQSMRKWIIVMCGFFLSFLTDGVRFSFGLTYKELLAEFVKGKGATASTGSLMFATMNFSGIIAKLTLTYEFMRLYLPKDKQMKWLIFYSIGRSQHDVNNYYTKDKHLKEVRGYKMEEFTEELFGCCFSLLSTRSMHINTRQTISVF